MSTLADIQDAVAKLSAEDKNALALWLSSQTDPELSPGDEERLLRSLDEAIRDIDAGRGVPIDDVRRIVRTWTAK